MSYNFYRIAWIIITYSVLGWCVEVVYAALRRGIFVNRGFLNGPVCPIYGFGVLGVVLMLEPFKENPLLLFFGSMIFCSLIEFCAGYAMERIFNDKWWDYSRNPFNIKGYICLEFSVIWGLACMMVVDILHPYIMDFIDFIPHRPGSAIIAAAWLLFAADFVLTLEELLKIPKRFKAVEELETALHTLSDKFGEKIIYAGVERGVERVHEYEEKHPEKAERNKERVQAVKKKHAALNEKIRDIELEADAEMRAGREAAAARMREKQDAREQNLQAVFENSMEQYEEYMRLSAEVQQKREELEKLLRMGFVHSRIVHAYPALLQGRSNGGNFRKFIRNKENKK